MATIKYASLETLTAFATQVKNLLNNKVDKQEGYSLTKNDLTDTLKGQYDAAYTHSQSAHAPSDAERNTIVGITVNGSDVTPDGSTRKVALTVPIKVSDLTNDSGFQTASDVSGAIATALEDYTDSTDMQSAIAEAVASAGHLKRTVVETLPESNQDEDTIYMIKDGTGTDQYTEHMWINGAWETIGSTRVDLSDYVTSESLTSTLANYVLAADMVAITSTEVEGLFA